MIGELEISGIDDVRSARDRACEAVHAALVRYDEIATRVLRRLEAWRFAHRLDRSVLVVDDSPSALAALAVTLLPLGVPIHAVTTDNTVIDYLRMQGIVPHRVETFLESAEVWLAARCAVVVVDWHLEHGITAGDVLDAIGRGPRAVIVTSSDEARSSLPDVARLSQATSVFRSGGIDSLERIREATRALLDEAAPGGCA